MNADPPVNSDIVFDKEEEKTTASVYAFFGSFMFIML